MKTKTQYSLRIGITGLLLFALGCSTNQPESSTPVAPIAIAPVGLSAYQSSTASLSENPTLDEYILYALRESTDLKSAFNTYHAALQRAPQVSALPEPKLSYGYFINSIETRVGPMQHRVGLAQPIPWFGKLSLKEDIANTEAKAAFYSFLLRKNNLVSQVTKAFYELAYLKEALEITDANLELLKRWERVLTNRYRSQTSTQADLIKVQVELGKLEDKLKELHELQEPLQAHFNALLNRPMGSEILMSATLLSSSSNEGDILSAMTQESLENAMQERNPDLQLLRALVVARESGIALARKDYYPDFSIGADYNFIGDREQAGSESGDDGLAAVFSVNIPINFSQYRAGVQEARYRRDAAGQTLSAKTFHLMSSLARHRFDLSDSKRRIGLFQNTLVPKAEESLQSTFTAFESGKASFLDLLDTERQLLDFQLMLSRAQADRVIRESQLRALIGDYSDMKIKPEGEEK